MPGIHNSPTDSVRSMTSKMITRRNTITETTKQPGTTYTITIMTTLRSMSTTSTSPDMMTLCATTTPSMTTPTTTLRRSDVRLVHLRQPQYSTAAVCVYSCVGKINGNYQYCPDCRKYVACSNGNQYIMPCPANLVWDDILKRCEWKSSTCPESTTERPTLSVCVYSCVGKINGNYQYCPDCRKYVACSNGNQYIMPCPANLVWDDILKRCEWKSSTCPESTTARPTVSELPTKEDTPRSTRTTMPSTIHTTRMTPMTTTPMTTTFRTTTASTTCGTEKCSTSPTITTLTITTLMTTPTTTTTSTVTTPTFTTIMTTPTTTTTSTITTPTVTTIKTTPTTTATSTVTSPMTTTLDITTPEQCHIPPPTDCCIRKQMRISLEEHVPVVFGKVPYVNVMEQTNGKDSCGCDAKILLNATFQKNSANDTCQGCTKVPMCGRKMLRIDLEMAPNTTGFSFHVGDSKTNKGYKGDASTQENNAEFHSLGYEHLLYGSDKCPNMSLNMTGLLSNSVTLVTIFIGNEFIRVSNNLGYVYELCSKCLFSLNGQSDSQGPVNEDIFIGLNRIIDSSSYREGSGVCGAVISWACPWNCLI
ncbi:hypothetical protein CHS0354_005474 [Potamilus streckersoni]|uniref:Chitin-binding type-2 domain-containing protein n=1 Tax=Potamilus streckersoni TaxID=2493646 RepID=A0AAE0VVV3_9BIVA|nr:hypothetical protein CHS0354_005474 [Potamilus streckersoni]